jgi:hypothetical protein
LRTIPIGDRVNHPGFAIDRQSRQLVTREELINLLQHSELPEFCITDKYLTDMLKKTDEEIHDEISHINSFWDSQYAQHRWRNR